MRPTPPQYRVLISAVENEGRVPHERESRRGGALANTLQALVRRGWVERGTCDHVITDLGRAALAQMRNVARAYVNC